MPGGLIPDDLQPIADFLKMSVVELQQQCLIQDWYGMGGDQLLIWKPVKMGARGFPLEKTGGIASFEYGFANHGYCIFFDRGSGQCKVHSVKPFECRAAMPCNEEKGVSGGISNRWMAHQWGDQRIGEYNDDEFFSKHLDRMFGAF